MGVTGTQHWKPLTAGVFSSRLRTLCSRMTWRISKPDVTAFSRNYELRSLTKFQNNCRTSVGNSFFSITSKDRFRIRSLFSSFLLAVPSPVDSRARDRRRLGRCRINYHCKGLASVLHPVAVYVFNGICSLERTVWKYRLAREDSVAVRYDINLARP